MPASYAPASSLLFVRVRIRVVDEAAIQDGTTPMGDERGPRVAEAIVYQVLQIE